MTPAPLVAIPLTLTTTGLLLGGVGLVAAIVALARLARAPEVFRAPLVPEQTVRIERTGPLRLCIEGPHFTTRFRGLSFTLADAATGVEVPLRRIVVRTRTSGWSRARLTIRGFQVERPGSYVLRIAGLAPNTAADGGAIVVVPAPGLRLPLAIVGCTLAGGLTVGSLVATILHFVPADGATATPAGTPRPTSAGRVLRREPAVVLDPKDVVWSSQGVHLRLPTGWLQRSTIKELDLRHPARNSTYVLAHGTPFTPAVHSADLLQTAHTQAAERVAAGQLEGYADATLGGVAGVLTIDSRTGRHLAIWTGYHDTPAGPVDLTFLFGAADADFDAMEPTFAAILDSIGF